MNTKRFLEIGGLLAGIVLVVFGAVAIFMGVDGRNTVRDSIAAEKIVFGTVDDPAVKTYAEKWAGQPVETGEQARAFAQNMHEHALEASGGVVYAEMGRYVAAANPNDPKGTSDAAAALKNEDGQPVSNAARNTWVTATALSSALNMSYMAENVSLFGIVMGVALLLAGVGFIILALFVLGPARETVAAPAGEAAPAAG
jgi:hypothetical protein